MRIPLFPGIDRPLVFAHRGLSAAYPENTMKAFKAARDAGIPGIEFDIHLTADGKLAVFHDDTTKRIGGSDKEFLVIEASTWDTLSAVDVGGERMPLLDEVFAEFRTGLLYDIEIKSRTIDDKGLERLLADTIDRFGLRGNCLVSSFNPFALRRFKRIRPGIPTAIIWSRSKELYWFLRRGEGRWIAGTDALKPQSVIFGGSRPRAAGRIPVLPWVVDDDAEAARVLAAGASGIISNMPERLRLPSRGYGAPGEAAAQSRRPVSKP
jgi:glycerophosphoryl diester phosphodiesterase